MNTTVPLIGIPENENVGAGDATGRRVMRLDGIQMDGAWTHNRHYFERHADTRVLECKSVWWFDVGGTIENVPEGAWEATLRIKYNRFADMLKGKQWTVSVDQGQVETTALSYETARPIVYAYEGEWVRLSFGVLHLDKRSNVRFSVFGRGEELGSTSGIHFGDFELRACGIGWEKERLLLLCRERKANDNEGACLLQELGSHCLGLITQMLITPMLAEIEHAGSLLRRPSDMQALSG